MQHPNPTSACPVASAAAGRRITASLPLSALTALSALAITLLLWGALPTPAGATPEPTPGPEARPAAAELITEPAQDAFVPRNSLTVTGTGTTLGNAITVSLNGAVACTTAVVEATPGELTWGCTITHVANGSGQQVLAVEQLDGETRDGRRTVHVLGPPAIDGNTPTTGVVSGSGLPGATVSVSLPGGAGNCVTTVTAGQYWSCTPTTAPGAVATSGVYQVSAAQSHPSIGAAGSRSVASSRTIEIDTVRPSPPVITSPRGDYRLVSLPATFGGTGEPGASVDVYIDGIPVCFATVPADSTWSCIGGADTTKSVHWINAIQRDIAGNHSDPTASLRVFFGPRADTTTPAGAAPTPSPSASAPPPPPSTPSPSTLPTFPSFANGFTLEESLNNWGSSTDFGNALPGLAESVERGNWWRAPLLALGAILLIALPLRLLATSLRGRIRLPFGRITGRNRPDVPVEDAHTAGANPWLAGFVPFAVAVAFIAVSSGISGEVRYLRLAFGVAVALAVLNVVGVAIAARIGYRWQGVDGRLRFLPLLLIAAIVLGLLSRLTGLVPPLVTGALIGIRFAHDTPVRKRAIVNLVEVGVMLALGVAGWIGHALVGAVVGFWPALLSETLAALCLAGLGSAVVLMIPLAALPGRTIMEWHPWAWFGVSFVIATIAFAVILGGSGARFPLGPLLLAAGGFAAACIAVWAWLRFVARSPA